VDQNHERLWEDMLAEFRALGGIADNVRLGDGPLGRGLFPVDPSIAIQVLIPGNLLVDPKYARIESDGVFRLLPEAPVGTREKAFLENYERNFSWGVSHQDTRALLEIIQEAPIEVREFLAKPLCAGNWLAGALPQVIAERFLSSRVYCKDGSNVIIPIVELANHGHSTTYEENDKGIGLSGVFSNEILVQYSTGDPLDFFQTWGFASPNERFALSLALRLKTAAGPLVIKRDRDPFSKKVEERPFLPEVSIEGDELTLSHMLLGHKEMPLLPRSRFCQLMRDLRRSGAEETFETIQHVNRIQFYKLYGLSESAPPRLGRLLRDVARYQLDAMSYCFGTAPV
jgi:hypothetical protein